jgi:transcriptional regulator with XRE-family HTH domain
MSTPFMVMTRHPAGGRQPAVPGRYTRPIRPTQRDARQPGTGNAFPQRSRPGMIGGAVVVAARRSARISRRQLARRMAVSRATVRAWESGALPLYSVSYGQLRDLTRQLAAAPAGPPLRDLLAAAQCDLLITGMLRGSEDYAEVPPIDDPAAGEPARGLLRWALTGDAPEPYRWRVRPRRLLSGRAAGQLTAVARDLRAGQHDGLASFGAALLALADGAPRPRLSRRWHRLPRRPVSKEER